MIPYLRQQNILNYLKDHHVMYFTELADYLGISVSTVRRDLVAMEQQGLLSILNGGAVTLQTRSDDAPMQKKLQLNIAQKELIAQKAAALVEDGDVIYIDSGTTTLLVLKYLKSKRLTIVTSSISLAREWLPMDATIIYLGGELLRDLESTVGSITEKQMLGMYFDKAFLGANAYSKQGIFTMDLREARKKEIAKNQSAITYVLADTSKRDKHSFAKVFALQECVLITEEDGGRADETLRPPVEEETEAQA